MHVLGIPVKDMSLGSTRTRFYYMLKNLPSGWTWSHYKEGASGDVLYIQKTETPPVWKAVKDCKRRGIPIVYERDDFCKPWNPEHTKIMNAADAVTIITKGLMKYVKKHTTTPLYHVFDGFDYDIQPEDRVPIRDELRKVTTYGRWINMEAIVPYYNQIHLKKTYISDRPIKGLNGSKLIEWKLHKFKRKLAKHDLIMIVHAENHRKKLKDIGRAMVGMAMGIPVAANSNIEVDRIYNEVGHSEMILNSSHDVKRIIRMLQPQGVRQKISDDFYEYAWKHWRPELASKKMAEVFERVIREKSMD